MSLSTGSFPTYWKKSYIVPVFKSGDKSNVINYRPISKLSIIPKLFESIITKNLSKLLSNYICPNQHGFQPKKSVFTNLLIYHTDLISSIENGCQIDTVYTDFSKAFDRVNHNLLIFKLQRFSLNGNFLKWLNSYLTNRSQSVKLSNSFSEVIHVCSGVPRG